MVRDQRSIPRVADRLHGALVASADGGSRSLALPFELTLTDGSEYPHTGSFLFANRQLDSLTGTLRIAASFPNPTRLLRPGEFARIRAATTVRRGALLVPQRAVTELQGTYQVMVLKPDSTVTVQPVTVGPRVDSLWVITGLQPNQSWWWKARKGTAGGKVAPNRTVAPRLLTRVEVLHQPPDRRHGDRLLMVIMGTVSILQLPVAQYPDIVPPEIVVQANYVGADALTIEQAVATPLEEQMSGVDSMSYMYSVNANNGVMQLHVIFDVGTAPNTDQIAQSRASQITRVSQRTSPSSASRCRNHIPRR
jgi:hypothetical protein